MEVMAMNEMDKLMRENNLTDVQAARLLRAALDQQAQVMQRARQIVMAMDALEDPRFTPETLRNNPEAMRAMEQGMGVGAVYRKYFIGEKAEPAQETEANLGLGGVYGEGLTPEEIARISAYVSKTGKTYEMD